MLRIGTDTLRVLLCIQYTVKKKKENEKARNKKKIRGEHIKVSGSAAESGRPGRVSIDFGGETRCYQSINYSITLSTTEFDPAYEQRLVLFFHSFYSSQREEVARAVFFSFRKTGPEKYIF